MARIILTTLGSHGDLHPYLALGRELSSHGHHAVIATSSNFRGDVESAGLPFALAMPEGPAPDDELYARIMDPWRGGEFLQKEILMPAIRDSYRLIDEAAEDADLLVSHVLTHATRIVAEKRTMPWISTVLSPMLFFSAFDFPIVPPLTVLRHLRRFGPAWNRRVLGLMKSATRSWSEPLFQFRRELALPEGGHPIFEGMHSPHGVLALFPRILAAAQADWPPKSEICGAPFLDEDFGGRPSDPRLIEFLTSGEPPLVFTLGSSAVRTAPHFFKEASKAAEAIGIRSVFVCGSLAEGLRLPEGSIAIPSAPYHVLFPAARLIVLSGGIGSVSQALRAGRPSIILPFAHDQFDNAERVTRIGAGVTLPVRHANAKNLIRAIRDLLADAARELNAVRAGESVRAENGVRSAREAIERLISG